MILHLTQDLMLSSTAAATARGLGQPYQPIPNLKKLGEKLGAENCQLLLVDLQLSGLDLAALGELLRPLREKGPFPVIGYAQHVETGLLEAGRQAGLDSVLTRGQVHHGLESLFSQL